MSRPDRDVVIVTAEPGRGKRLGAMLEARGLFPRYVPCIRIEPTKDLSSLRGALANRPDWIVVTSSNAVAPLAQALEAHRGAVRIAAVGPKTAKTLKTHGMRAELVPSEASQDHLGKALLGQGVAGARVLLVQGNLANQALAGELSAAGAIVDRAQAYSTVEGVDDPTAARAALEDKNVLAVTLLSGSSARALRRATGPDAFEKQCFICIGPSTARETRRLGATPQRVAKPHTLEGVVVAVVEESVKGRKR